MSEVWNSWDLKPPPVCTVRTELHLKEINELKQTTSNALKTLRTLKVLNREAAILSRFLYKHKRVFRHDKGMQNLVKVNQSLRRYLKLDFKEVVSNFEQSLPRKLSGTTHAYLPTKQMLKWVLLRLQAFSQIFTRILKLTKETGVYIYQKLFLGWSWKLYLVVFCMTARIMVLSKFLVAKSVEWYSCFYKCLPILTETAAFVPEYTFPTDLKDWQGPVDLTPLKKKTLIDNIFEIIDLTEGDMDEDDDEVKIVNEKLIKFFKTNFNTEPDIEEITVEDAKEEGGKGMKRSLEASMSEDLGEPIIIEEVIERPRKKKKNKEKKHSIEKKV